MVYGRYNELVFMGFINPLTKLGGTILWGQSNLTISSVSGQLYARIIPHCCH